MGTGVVRMHDKVVAEGLGWARQQLADQVVPHLYVDKLGVIIGEQDRLSNSGFQHGEIKPQNL